MSFATKEDGVTLPKASLFFPTPYYSWHNVDRYLADESNQIFTMMAAWSIRLDGFKYFSCEKASNSVEWPLEILHSSWPVKIEPRKTIDTLYTRFEIIEELKRKKNSRDATWRTSRRGEAGRIAFYGHVLSDWLTEKLHQSKREKKGPTIGMPNMINEKKWRGQKKEMGDDKRGRKKMKQGRKQVLLLNCFLLNKWWFFFSWLVLVNPPVQQLNCNQLRWTFSRSSRQIDVWHESSPPSGI